MKVLEVLIEHRIHSLDRPFSYLYSGTKIVEKGFRVLISFNNQLLVGYVLSCADTNKNKEELEKENGFEILEVFDVLDDTPLLNEELFALADEIASYYVAPRISVFQSMLPSSLTPRKSTLKAPKIAYDTYLAINEPYNEEGLTSKQIEILRLIDEEVRILKRDVASPSIVEKLLKLNRIKLIKEERRRLAIPDYEYKKPPVLKEDQQKVIDEILTSKDNVFLLEGITGSGKTEVYLSLIEKAISEGNGAIFLVPEISLTPMMMEYLLTRFKNNVAILHSNLTPAEKYDEYRKISEGECKIVIGARSAIFAPVHNLKYIILDEEHVESYKQDNTPCYHAREVAIMRSKLCGCKVILGSATPSLETKARASKGIYHQLYLTKRINEQKLPTTQIVDLTDRRNIDRESYMFSIPLRNAIRETLNKGEQVILLLNRRGFSTNITCRKCGHTFTCPNCNIALTYHKSDNMLKCHHCGHVIEMPSKCPDCGSTYLSKTGFGSERVEEEVIRLFPDAKTIRIDSDSTRSRTKLPLLIERFRKKEANVLIGTQMIAKGHDFPGVSLVGIVLADIGLAMPSYRSSERTFQLITQAIGRCGRGEIPGKAIIQAYLPRHYSITLGSKQNYRDFYITEMANRKLQNYPPFYYLASLIIKGNNDEILDENINEMKDFLELYFEKEKYQIIGPSEPYISHAQNYKEKQLLIKYKNVDLGNRALTDLVNAFKSKYGIEIFINIDPYNF